MTAAYGGCVYIADTSARARADHPAVRAEWSAALRSDRLPEVLPFNSRWIAAPGSL